MTYLISAFSNIKLIFEFFIKLTYFALIDVKK